MEEWHEFDKEFAKDLPKKSDIVKVKLKNGDETKAYFYADKIGWIAFYGHKTGYFWHKDTKELIDHIVTHWRHLRTVKDE